jgi:hypothetical protein
VICAQGLPLQGFDLARNGPTTWSPRRSCSVTQFVVYHSAYERESPRDRGDSARSGTSSLVAARSARDSTERNVVRARHDLAQVLSHPNEAATFGSC